MNVLICPDKFKGSLSAKDVAQSMKAGVLRVKPDAQFTLLPLADGGEGSLAAIQSVLNLVSHKVVVSDPLGRKVECEFSTSTNDKVAFIEMAQASGLQLLQVKERHTKLTSTYGTGETISKAIDLGMSKIVLMVGGSATTDGGIGMMSALGFKFFNSRGNEVNPIGQNMIDIQKIISSDRLENISFEILTDVDNFLFGAQGAAYVYAPQKGATANEVAQLDRGLMNLSKVIEKATCENISEIKGVGAAGGISALLLAYGNAQIRSGIHTIMKYLHFHDHLQSSDLVITGEGKLDDQTLKGKVIKGVIDQSISRSKPMIIVCGENKLNTPFSKPFDVVKIQPLLTEQLTLEHCMKNAKDLVTERTEQALRGILK